MGSTRRRGGRRRPAAPGSRRGPRRTPALGGQAAVSGRGALELLGQVVGALRAQVGAEGVGQLGRDHPVGPGEARRAQLGPEPADPALQVGRGAGPLVLNRAGQDDVGVGVDRLRRVPGHGDDEVAGRQRRLATAWSGKSLSGSAPSSTRARTCGPARRAAVALAGHGGQDVGRIEPGVGRDGAPGRGEALAAGVEARPARAAGRGQAHVERAEHVAPAQRGQEGRLGQRLGQHAQGGGGHLARLGVGRAPGHDDDAVAVGVLGQQGPGGLERAVGQRAALVVRAQRRGGGVVTGQGLGHQRRVAGPDGAGWRRRTA